MFGQLLKTKLDEKMNPDEISQTRPVCVFGPGGDFISIWPSGSIQPGDTLMAADTSVKSSIILHHNETILFPEDTQIHTRTSHKPKHRIRTYRRTAKKSSASRPAGQGLLFDDNFKRIKTA